MTRSPTTNARMSSHAVRHVLLQAEHVAAELQGAEHAIGGVAVADPYHATTLRAEERLDDHVAAQLLVGEHGIVETLSDHRARRRQTRVVQARRGVVLVDTVFDGVRGIDYPDAVVLEHAQGVHAEDDLLQRARWDRPDEDHLTVIERHRRGAETRTLGDPRAQLSHGIALRHDAAPCERCAQALRVPAPVLPEDRDLHANNEARRTAALTSPAWKVLPLAALVIVISAGLNRRGSIL